MLTKSILSAVILPGLMVAQQGPGKTPASTPNAAAAQASQPAAGPKTAAPEGAGLHKQVDTLQKEVKQLKQQLETANNLLSETYRRVEALDHSKVNFDPFSPVGYGRMDSVLGTILVSLGKVEALKDGYSAELRIGNPYATDFVGCTVDATWGRKIDFNHYAAWHSTLKKQHFSFTDKLPAAQWTSVTLTFPDTKAEGFRYLDISVQTDVVSMNLPTR